MLGHTPEAILPFAMIRTIAPTVWAFDCEWVPDADAGRRLLALDPDTPEPDVFEAMWTAAGASPEQPRPFLKLLHCRLASVAVVERRVCASGSAGSEVALRLCSLPREGATPKRTSSRRSSTGSTAAAPSSSGSTPTGPTSRSSPSAGSCSASPRPGFCRRPDRPWEGPDYFHPHNDWNVDLMRAVGGRGAACPSLRDLAVLSGIPAKTHGDGPCSGGDVADLWLAGRRDDIRRYNECDAADDVPPVAPHGPLRRAPLGDGARRGRGEGGGAPRTPRRARGRPPRRLPRTLAVPRRLSPTRW